MGNLGLGCPPKIRSKPYVSGPNVFFLHIVGQVVGGAQFDLPFKLPFPCNTFFMASTAQVTNSLFLSLMPTRRNNQTGSGAITMLGSEEWFPMNAVPLAGTNYWAMLRFSDPTQQIYISMGTESGAPNIVTIACVADDALQMSGGIWT